jgi:hypothetical protein
VTVSYDWVVGDKEGQWPWGKGLYLSGVLV